MKRVAILGSTGTIGDNALEIVRRFPSQFEVVALAAGKNVEKLATQIEEFRPKYIAVSNAHELTTRFPDVKVASVDELCAIPEVDVVVMGIVGFAAMAPTIEAIRRKKTIALANKESLVVAGSLLRQEIAKHGACVIPVDSEHNALFQLLEGRRREDVQSIVLTASGGPLFRLPEMPLEDVTPAVAIKHPNWKMGPKISVDSATLMNKGLELIEAHFLFEYPESRIEVWVHPQSIVHGAIWLVDNSCLAQLTIPDMKSSIGHAMQFPEKLPSVISKLSFRDMAKLEFFEPDVKRFPCLNLARRALEAGPSTLVALNAANEVAVARFLEGKLLFSKIAPLIEETLTRHPVERVEALETVFRLDAASRQLAVQVAESL